MDEETLEALLAGSDDEVTEADEHEDAGSDLEDLEGEFRTFCCKTYALTDTN